MTEEQFVKEALQDSKLGPYLKKNFLSSLAYMGYPKELIESVFFAIENNKIEELITHREKDLYELQDIGFFQNHAPQFAEKFLLPPVPPAKNVLDLGCGRGGLMSTMSKLGRFEKLTGIDINSYEEWKGLESSELHFEVVKEDKFNEFIKEINPDMVMVCWVLHHMKYDEQERYLDYLSKALEKDTYVVVLEDCYSTKLPPEEDHGVHEEFMAMSLSERKTIISVYDWVANRILARKKEMPIPFAFRTFEEWVELFAKYGFNYFEGHYIGFAEHRDVNTPQSLLIFKRG
jgi:SAM-dependent methyltransferase